MKTKIEPKPCTIECAELNALKAHVLKVEAERDSLKVTNTELLAALEEMVQDSECYCADNVAHKGQCGYCKARAAIAKAKGE